MRPYFSDKDLDILECWWHSVGTLELISFDDYENIQHVIIDLSFEMEDRKLADQEWEEWCAEVDDELE